MAEQLSGRELRVILRDRARERQLREEQDKRNALLTVRESDHPENLNFSDAESEMSNLNTIDEFLHESTTRDIRELEQLRHESLGEERYRHSTRLDRSDERNSMTDNLAFIDQHIERLSQTLLELREDDTHVKKANWYEESAGNADRVINVDTDKDYHSKYSDQGIDKRVEGTRKERVSERSYRTSQELKGFSTMEQNRNGIEERLARVQIDRDEIKSQSSYYERESLKTKKLQLEEKRKQLLMLENEQKLQQEIERKKQDEKELLERIIKLEDQETELSSKRNENERLEKLILAKRHEDEALSQKIALLKEKENILKQKAEICVRHKDNKEDDTLKQKIIRLKEKEKLLKQTADTCERQKDNMKGIKAERYRSNSDEEEKERYRSFKLGSPKIPPFNGTRFESWKMEVTCVMQTHMYPDYAIVQSIRNSLKDETREVLLTLKATASSTEIMDKLSEIYGDIKTEDTVVQDFYSAKQKQVESISVWGVRVETLFQKAVAKGEIDERKRDKKLKERFWRGLRSEKLKLATRVSYESTDSFEQLRRKARLEEEEETCDSEKETSAPVNVNALQEKKLDEKLGVLQELLDRMKTMETDIGKLKDKSLRKDYNNPEHYSHNRPFRGGYRGNRRYQDRNQYQNRDNRSNYQDHGTKKESTEKKATNENKQPLNEKELPPEGSMEAQK